MIKAILDKASLGIAGGICLFISAVFVAGLVKAYVPRDVSGTAETLAATIAILSPFFLVFLSAIATTRGCLYYAKAKGYPAIVGVMLGIFPYIGFIALFIFFHHHKNPGSRGFPIVPRAWENTRTHAQ